MKTVAYEAGKVIAVAKSVQAESDTQYTTDCKNPATIRALDNGLRIGNGKQNVTVSNLLFDTSPADPTAGVSCSGYQCQVNNIEQVGPGKVLQFDAAEKLHAIGIYARNGKQRDKGFYAGGAPSHDCWLEQVELWIPPGDPKDPDDKGGQHCGRIHNFRTFHLGGPNPLGANAKLNGGAGAKWSVYCLNTGTYNGSALTIKDGDGALIENGRFDGGFSIECLPINVGKNQGYVDPKTGNKVIVDWRTVRSKNVTVRNCEINTHLFLHVGSGVENFRVEKSVVRAVKPSDGKRYDTDHPHGACLDLNGPRGPQGEWPAGNGTFEGVKFYGDKLYTDASKPWLSRWTFINCTLTTPDGKTRIIGNHGELL